MQRDTLAQQIETMEQRLQAWQRRASALPEQQMLLAEAVEELSAFLEGLSVAAEELRQQNDELEIRVKARNAELAESNQALQNEIAERKRIEDALRESKENLRAMFELAGIGQAQVDPASGRFMRVNRKLCEMTGYTAPELLGMTFTQLTYPEDREADWAKYQQVLRGEVNNWFSEKRYIRQDGEIIWVEVNGTLIRDAAGNPLHSVAVIADITERKQAEQERERLLVRVEQEWQRTEELALEAQQRAALLDATVAAIAEGVLIYGPSGEITRMNPAAEKIFGYSPSEHDLPLDARVVLARVESIDGRPFVGIEDMPAQRVLRGEAARSAVIAVRDIQGDQRIWVSARAAPIQSPDGKLLGAVALYTDITELRRARDELELRVQERTQELANVNEELRMEVVERQQVEEYLRLQTTAVRAAANGIVITDRQGNIQWCNPAFTQMTGYTAEEVLGQNLRLLQSDQQTPEFYRHHWETILTGGGWRGEMVNRRKDGNLYVEEQTITPVPNERGEITHFVAIKQDVTDRRRAEEALRQNEAMLRAVLETLPAGVWILDKRGQIVLGNPAAQAIWAGERYVGIDQYGEYKGWWLDTGKLIEPGEWAAARAITKGETSLDEQVEIECFDGTYKIILNSAMPIRDAQQEIVGAIIVNQDITERKRAEEAIRLANAYNRSLIEASLDPLVTIGPDGRITDVNAATEQVTGYSRLNLIGTDFSDYFTEPEKARAGYQRVFREGTVRDYELELLHRDGPVTSVLYNASVYRDEAGRVIGVFAAARDITERKRVEAQLERNNQELRALSLAERNQRLLAETLSAANLALTQNLNLETVMETLLNYVEQLVPYDSANVMLLETESRMAVRATRGYERWTDAEQSRAITFDVQANPLFNKLFTKHQSILVLDTHTCPGWEIRPGTEHVRSWIGVPLTAGGNVIGVYSLDKTEPGFFTQEHVRLAEILVGQAAVAIQNARLFEQVHAGREQLRLLARQVVSVQEQERRRVSRELHDEAGQALTALKISLELAMADLPDKAESLRERIRESVILTDDTMERIRLLARDLRPPALDAVGLSPTLEDVCRDFGKRTQLSIDYEGEKLPVLPDAVSICLYRVLQEALTNVARHAQARHVWVALRREVDSISLSVDDDGQGFDLPVTPSFTGRPMGIGLLGMRDRLELLGGGMEIDSQPGKGTRLVAHVPWEEAE
jgi:PAS domain S-box-containing protein